MKCGKLTVWTATAMLACAVCVVAEQKKAPAFELPDVGGGNHTLEQYAGSVVVLEWTNYDCPFVKKFYGAGVMQALQKEFIDKGIVWLSICSSAPGKQGHFTVEEWKKRMEKDKVAATAVLLDIDGKTGRAYEAKTTPHMYIINAEGNLVYQGAIDDKPSTNPETLEGSRNYVREVLEAILEGKEPPVTETKPYGCTVKY